MSAECNLLRKFPRHVKSEAKQTDATHNKWTVKVGGQEREFGTEITEQHPEARVAWKAVDGDIDHGGVVTFHKLGDAESRVTVQIDWQPTGLLETLGAVSGVVEHAVKKDLENFTEFIENQGATGDGWRKDVKN